MFELLIRLQHTCPHNNLSIKYPKARISLWCDASTDILEIEADSLESYESIQKDLSRQSDVNRGRVLSKSIRGGRFQIVAKTCSCGFGTSPTEPVFERHNFLEVPPVILTGGWEHYRLIGFDENSVKGILRELDKMGTSEVLRKKSITESITDDYFLASLSTLFGELTGKQLSAMVTALEKGYYEVPKKVTTESLAEHQKQPRSTMEEHLRKAESKVLHAMEPFMMMYSRSPTHRRTPSRTVLPQHRELWNAAIAVKR